MNLDEAMEKAAKLVKLQKLRDQAAKDEERFYKRLKKELAELPEEFRGVVSRHAWEHGHSAGYDEVLYYVRDLVGNLKEPCQKYAERIRKEAK